jgi:hypothetical protein
MSKSKILSRDEALDLLSDHIRKKGVDDDTLLKLISFYAKLSGWDKEKPEPADEEPNIEQLIQAMEKQKRQAKSKETL